ncbi:MFS transporter [Lederbergia wuyishanensis]|uniref:MFS family permease n=1 Tax=Lederbergia wuyishanensis TaxID=1347903 RepID=A0ABU0CZ14_9BACI|nr:MFS transporter [Lederbergia wuyishanensis]MCJ8006032.1 MFS transporter [Lederbergia wuyishanensis]MDQ0341399.1 MFS family permease [Lederbergia wuyishanensis]
MKLLLKENSAFRNLFIGRILCIFADSVLFFSLLKWLEVQSTSGNDFTLFYIAFYLPVFLFALPIGAWINNKTLQKVMMYSNLVQVFMISLFLLFIPYMLYQWAYLLLIFISILGLFFVPANQSLLPHIVGNDDRPKANSLLQLGYTAVKIIGQVFTATMIKVSFTPATLITISIVLLIVSIFFINNIKPFVKRDQTIKHSQWKLIIEGVSYITKHPKLKALFLFLALAMLFATSVDLILISYLSDILHVGVENLSFIGTASVCGIAIGATIVPKYYKKIEKKWFMIPPLFALSISIGSLFFITNWVLILPFFLIQGIALGCFNVTFVTYLQDVVSSENYTRTFSLYNMIFSSMALSGIMMTGLFINKIGVLNTILVISFILFVIGIVGIYFTPKLGHGQLKEDNLNEAL